MVDHQLFGYERYCLEKSENALDGWKLMICNHDANYHKIFNFVGMNAQKLRLFP